MKYFKTPHLPNSPGIGSATRDDKILSSVEHFLNKKLTATVKMDGSNVCLSKEGWHARSTNGVPAHASFDRLKALHASMKNDLNKDLLYYGEWLYARHSIQYHKLESYLQIFNIYSKKREEWLSCDEVEADCKKVNFIEVPLIYNDIVVTTEDEFEGFIKDCLGWLPSLTEECEGLVIRVSDSFKDPEISIAKWVRANHVQSDEHWTNQIIVKNLLRDPK